MTEFSMQNTESNDTSSHRQSRTLATRWLMRLVAYRSSRSTRRRKATSATGLSTMPVDNCNVRFWLLDRWVAMTMVIWFLLSRCRRNVDPTLMVVAGDLRSEKPAEDRMIRFLQAMADDRLVDLTGDDKQKRAVRRSKCCLDAGRIEQAEGNVQRFAEGSVVVVVD